MLIDSSMGMEALRCDQSALLSPVQMAPYFWVLCECCAANARATNLGSSEEGA